MPRIQRNQLSVRTKDEALVSELIAELRNSRPNGQPRIDEERFPRTGKIRINVLWDKWHGVPEYERIPVIQAAYEKVESREFNDDIVMVMGLTFPEAYELGMLPFQIIAGVRPGDRITIEECRNAMLEEGASTLFRPETVELRFATEEEAIESKKRLSQSLPGSEGIWIILQSLVRPTDPELDS